jgi:hypothetical protein
MVISYVVLIDITRLQTKVQFAGHKNTYVVAYKVHMCYLGITLVTHMS